MGFATKALNIWFYRTLPVDRPRPIIYIVHVLFTGLVSDLLLFGFVRSLRFLSSVSRHRVTVSVSAFT